MSATNRGTDRRQDDAYYTPAWCVEALLRTVRLPGGTWLDPCAGDGAIIRATLAVRNDVDWQACDIRPECYTSLRELTAPLDAWTCDFLGDPSCFDTRARVIVTNPPYSLAMEFVRRSLEVAPTVAMLLRLPFLASQRRASFFRERCPDVYVLPKRPSFTGDGRADATDYMWAVWGPVPQTAGRVAVLEV